jgi:hypothetical protein
MVTAALAVVVGLVIGRATGGSTAAFARLSLRTWPLLVGGAVMQTLAQIDALDRIAYPLVVASYAALLVVGVRNLHLVGMGLVVAGIALNASVIVANHGMPVRPSAAEAAGVDRVAAGHHFERPSDRLVALGDVLPARPLGEVLSVGDLILAVGLADLVVRMTRRGPARSVYRQPRRRGAHVLGVAASR